MEKIVPRLGRMRRWAPRLGPYLVIALILPGGILLALTLFLMRRNKGDRGRGVPVHPGRGSPQERSVELAVATRAKGPRRATDACYRPCSLLAPAIGHNACVFPPR